METNSPSSAGADTVTCALQSFIYHTIRHPTAWRRLQAEIDEAAANHHQQQQQQGEEDISQDHPVFSFAEAQKLSYLQACIKESIRVCPPSTIGLQRVAPRSGITIGDRNFKAGTVLSVHLPSILLSEELWGADAHDFVPDRWLIDEKKTAALDKYFIPVSLFHPLVVSFISNDYAVDVPCHCGYHVNRLPMYV